MNNVRPGRGFNGVKSDPIVLYVETDPTGRYGRFREILGKGAMKVVYRGFDEVQGIEVAWNQIKLNEVFRSPDEINRLYSEVHLLKNLRHDSIINFHTSWIDPNRRTFNFITEMFTSGTLREYRQKYQRVDIRAIKNWTRQILRGLSYLHGLDPPVIHRDLKCDNIFVNGHLGQVKIGDLGLAAILRGSHHAHSVIGTPEFMAPELYEEDYDELVDIYSFGMCLLEMLTSEYPYSECSNPAQIYKKVTSGKLPEAFHRIQDPEAKQFVGKCLENVSQRLSARELLLDPFLACDNSVKKSPDIPKAQRSISGISSARVDQEEEIMVSEVERTTNMLITGTMDSKDDAIYLKVQISDICGKNARNIYFPFDITADTPIDVATEMVKELDIDNWEPGEIAVMIEEQILSLVPSWESPTLVEDSLDYEQLIDVEEDEEYEDIICNQPFYASSSCSSSQTSLLTLNSPNSLRGGNINSLDPMWIQDNLVANDDLSSVSSLSYSNINYYSAVEELDHETAHKSTRFCPQHIETMSSPKPKATPKLTRIKSLVDVRSQLLHRSLVEEINKRRMFKTVGDVESVGFQDLADPFSVASFSKR